MSSEQEKKLFSERLKQALRSGSHPISPTYLSKHFNDRYDGTPVSVQSANNWLLGKAIPNQDKLSLLSNWLDVSSQWLRFGDVSPIIESSQNKQMTENLEFLSKVSQLNTNQRKLVEQLVNEFINLS
ncbi:hypothetical protein GFH30_04030 [Acinetobacter wanghuae]|uniref:HTH cro/C1-type domain-containing protein n=1 Tax=Acinetobacter wanghuae TaxID=2662362 RepID=A0A5Q0P0E7_9GAMM|nr:hypothetical protein [Acinetobacter wanghuae]MQW93345.1 hypothetical protein [Acinetobacter wanghuae]QGA10617.1 hypothetical protein GFH30_04030 [Acinetobacter wanghuae]